MIEAPVEAASAKPLGGAFFLSFFLLNAGLQWVRIALFTCHIQRSAAAEGN